jgi:crotonobetainyl-CoA:carnitine CoA-transferase CaiB-like acyl-CoA transferase
MSEEKPAQNGPLADIRMVDLTAIVMESHCTQIIAAMGANLIRVEPAAGKNTRCISVAPGHGMSGVFANVNRGNHSIALDLQSAHLAISNSRACTRPGATLGSRY